MKKIVGSDTNSPVECERIYLSGVPLIFAPTAEGFVISKRRKSHNRMPRKLLKIGSGVGSGLEFLNWAMESQDYGIKGSCVAIKSSNKQFGQRGFEYRELKVESVPPIDFPDQNFEAVVYSAILQRDTLDSIGKIAGEIRRVLRPRGIFFCSLKSENQLPPSKGTVINEEGFENPAFDEIRHFISQARNLDLFQGFDPSGWHVLPHPRLAKAMVVTGIFKMDEKTKKSPQSSGFST